MVVFLGFLHINNRNITFMIVFFHLQLNFIVSVCQLSLRRRNRSQPWRSDNAWPRWASRREANSVSAIAAKLR
jgi:hypothetical protein